MSLNHLLSDTLARIRNAQLVKKSSLVVHYSKLIKAFLETLLKEGYIDKLEEFEERKGVNRIKIFLKYFGDSNAPVIKEMKMISKPAKRVYRSYKNIDKVYGGLGVVVLSTSKGVLTDSEAREMRVGGEVLCNIF